MENVSLQLQKLFNNVFAHGNDKISNLSKGLANLTAIRDKE